MKNGGSVPHPRHPHELRHARPGGQRHRLRARRAWASSRTEHMFFEGRPHRRHARNDPRRRRDQPPRGPGQNSSLIRRKISRASSANSRGYPATIRFLDPPLARVPAARKVASRKDLAKKLGVGRRQDRAARQRTPRVQPDARASRLPVGPELPGDQRNAGARRVRGRRRGPGRGHQGETRDHDSARGFCPRTPTPDRGGPPGGRCCRQRKEGQEARLPRRHDDRNPPGLRDGGQDRRERAVLLLRHQRPDPDDARHEPRRLGQFPATLRGDGNPAGQPVRVHRPDGRRQADGDRHGVGTQDAAPTSSWASAASTAANPPA